MSAKSEQAKAKRREYNRAWHQRFREEHGMSYTEARTLRKAMKLINTITERTQADD